MEQPAELLSLKDYFTRVEKEPPSPDHCALQAIAAFAIDTKFSFVGFAPLMNQKRTYEEWSQWMTSKETEDARHLLAEAAANHWFQFKTAEAVAMATAEMGGLTKQLESLQVTMGDATLAAIAAVKFARAELASLRVKEGFFGGYWMSKPDLMKLSALRKKLDAVAQLLH